MLHEASVNDTRITLARFTALVEAYGAEEARWPADERAAATAFAQRDEQAASVLAEARALDSLLALDRPASAPSDLLRARILAKAPKAASGRRNSTWAPYAALAACAVFGAFIGIGGGLLVPVQSSGAARIVAEAPLSPSGAPEVINGGDSALDADAADLMIEIAFGGGPSDADWQGDGG